MRRIPSLDGLRAISIALVVLAHLSLWHHISFHLPYAIGGLGVQIFFVISGYLITKLLLREQERTNTISLTNFYIRRAFRIFPAAYVFIVIIAVLHWHEIPWYHLVVAVLYLANMDGSMPSMFGHLWSLGIEEQFYLLWPFALKKWFRYRVPILIAVMFVTPLVRTAVYAFKWPTVIARGLPVFADQLAIGCLLAIFEGRIPKINRWLALTMVAAIALIPFFPATTPARTIFMLFILRPLLDCSIAGVLLHVVQSPYRILNWAPVAWVGRISYSLYLWQEPFCADSPFHHGYALVLPAIACASASYYLVEQPILRLREKFVGKPDRVRASELRPDSSIA